MSKSNGWYLYLGKSLTPMFHYSIIHADDTLKYLRFSACRDILPRSTKNNIIVNIKHPTLNSNCHIFEPLTARSIPPNNFRIYYEIPQNITTYYVKKISHRSSYALAVHFTKGMQEKLLISVHIDYIWVTVKKNAEVVTSLSLKPYDPEPLILTF